MPMPMPILVLFFLASPKFNKDVVNVFSMICSFYVAVWWPIAVDKKKIKQNKTKTK